MNQTDRIGLFESLLDTFLTRAREKGYIILEVLGRADEFVQFQMHSGRVYGEVGSRQWSEPEPPLGPGPVAALAALGDEDQHRVLDLCFAVAADEAEPFLKLLWVPPEILARLQHDARLVLSAAPDTWRDFEGMPAGLPTAEGTSEERAEEFFRRIWEILEKEHSRTAVDAVAGEVMRAVPERDLVHPLEIIRSHRE